MIYIFEGGDVSVGSLSDSMRHLTINDKDVTAANQSMKIPLPNEIFLECFYKSVLGVDSIVLMQTCQAFYKVFSNNDLWKQIFDREGMSYFDETKCWKYRGNPGQLPPISLPKAYQYFNSDCKLFPGKKVKETHKLQLFYKEIDGKPMTTNHAKVVARNPKAGSGGIPARFDNVSWNRDVHMYGNKPLSKSFWAFVAVKSLNGTWDMPSEEKLKVVANYAQYRLHTLFERVVVNFDHMVETGQYLDDKHESTICEDTIEHNFGMGKRKYCFGVGVSGDSEGLAVYLNEFDGIYNGVAFTPLSDRGVTLLRQF